MKDYNAVTLCILFLVAVIDVGFRTISVALLLKLVQSKVLKFCFSAFFLAAYGSLAFFGYDAGLCWVIIMIISYPIVNFHYNELEAICRGIVTISIFIFAYTRDVINEGVLGVTVTLSLFYIIFSFWRICVRDEWERVRKRTAYLLSCSCCTSIARELSNQTHRTKDPISKDDKVSNIEIEVSSVSEV